MKELVPGQYTSEELCQEIAERSGGVCLLGFSRGKDSIVAWLKLRQFFKRVIPFHAASVLGLGFVERSLAYYERVFDTPIERCVSGELTESLFCLDYQPIEDADTIEKMNLWQYNNNDIADRVREKHGVPGAWVAYGINMTDSLDRRIYIKNRGGINEEHLSFYPCFDYKRERIMSELLASGIKLPEDYLLACRSFAGLPTVRHLERMERIFPEDFAIVEAHYPFIRAQMARAAFRLAHQEVPNGQEDGRTNAASGADPVQNRPGRAREVERLTASPGARIGTTRN